MHHLAHAVFELYMHLFMANNVIKELPVKRIALPSVTAHALDSHLFFVLYSLYFLYVDCRPPLTPTAPPTLTPVVNSTRAGVYTIDLTHTVPSSPLLSHNVVFLFEIFDNTTGNYSYHWLVRLQYEYKPESN